MYANYLSLSILKNERVDQGKAPWNAPLLLWPSYTYSLLQMLAKINREGSCNQIKAG